MVLLISLYNVCTWTAVTRIQPDCSGTPCWETMCWEMLSHLIPSVMLKEWSLTGRLTANGVENLNKSYANHIHMFKTPVCMFGWWGWGGLILLQLVSGNEDYASYNWETGWLQVTRLSECLPRRWKYNSVNKKNSINKIFKGLLGYIEDFFYYCYISILDPALCTSFILVNLAILGFYPIIGDK